MKIRVASIVLALGLLFSIMTVAFANDAAESVEVVETEVVEEVEPTAVFYLDGEPLYDVVAQCVDGTYYVTLASMMSVIDETAVVEESSGVATLTAEAVVVTEVEEEVVATEAEEAAEEEAVPEEEETPVQPSPMPVYLGNGFVVMPPVTATSEEEEQVEAPEEEAEVEVEEVTEAEAVVEAVAEVVDTLALTAAVGEEYLIANGRYLYVEDGVISLDGSVAVPIRLLAEALKMSVSYDAATGCVHLTSSEEIGYLEDGETYYNAESLYWLSRIIYSESGNQSMAGKIAVGNVVMNRVYNPNFPDTIYDVIFQKNQFSPASSGSIYREPNASSVIAAKLVLDGAEVMGDALFFNRVGLKCYASRNRTFVATIGGHSFYA